MMMLSSQAASRRLAQARLLRSFTSTKPVQSDQPYDVVVIGTLIMDQPLLLTPPVGRWERQFVLAASSNLYFLYVTA
jgi:hypothetical protein